MNEGANPYDELTALFVTGPDEPPDKPSPTIELVVVGSLPVRASLWLGPYVEAISRDGGPAALLRLDGEEATIQLAGEPASLTEARWPTLMEAIAAIGPHVGTWVVRPPLDAAPADLAAYACDRITILCSVNDSAIVDAYQRVKSLVEAARSSGRQPPPLGVAVFGSDRHDAVHMQEQLSRTTASYLHVELPLVACVQRMGADPGLSDCLSFAGEHPVLATALLWIREATGAAGPANVAPATPVSATPVPATPVPATPVPALGTDEAPSIKLMPKPSVEVEPKGPLLQREPAVEGMPMPMAGYIDGVTALDVRCPGHERLELGVDADGRLHVLAREAAMRELHVVEAWARAHRELIAKACPGNWFDPQSPTVLHVFTEQPTAVTDLHGCQLRLHVLAPAPGEGEPRWYYAPLNTSEDGGRRM